jgi:outer membrane protein OmpA-like peptidoglycan-associated protein
VGEAFGGDDHPPAATKAFDGTQRAISPRRNTTMFTMIRSTSIAALALAPFITGCATKKFVKATVAPIEQKVGDLDSTTKAQAKSIEELERGVARADERAQGAQGRADQANAAAELARKEAAEGRTIAEQGLNAANQTSKALTASTKHLTTRIENLQNMTLVSTENVLFKFGSHTLDADATAALDQMVAKAGSLKNFVVEVQGFTDKSGSKAYNLELSRKRADSVVRYLTLKHSIPLHRIYMAGFGMESQIAEGANRREVSRNNRRVELKLYVNGDQATTSQISAIPTTSND